MGQLIITRISDTDLVQKKAAERLSQLFNENSDKPILFLSSGGSVTSIYDYVKITKSMRHTTIGMLDERIGRKLEIRNFPLLKNSRLFKNLINRDATLLVNSAHPKDTLESYGNRFSQKLDNWISFHPHGIVIVTLGISLDGHMAGICPYPDNPKLFTKLFLDPQIHSLGYNAGRRNPQPLRVTVTTAFLRLVNYSVLYIVGEEKRRTLNKVLITKSNIHDVPGRIIQLMRCVYLFTDIMPGENT